MTQQGHTGNATITVTMASTGAGSVGRSVQTSQGSGSETETEAWTARSVTITTSTLSGLQCQWSPAVLYLVLPLGVGAHWSSVSHCVVNYQGSNFDVQRSMQASVVGTARYTVGGVSTPVWIIDRTDDLNGQGQGQLGSTSLASQSATTEWFAPAVGLVVQSTGSYKATTTYAGSTSHTSGTTAMKALALTPS